MNPGAVTLYYVLLSSALQAACDCCSESFASIDEPIFRLTLENSFTSILTILTRAKPWLKRQPYFNTSQDIGLVQTVPNWYYYWGHYGYPIAVTTV